MRQCKELKSQARDALQRRDYELAVRLYTQAIDLSSGVVALYSNRASALMHLKCYRQALADADQILVLMPNSPQV